MNSEATLALHSLVMRISKFIRKQESMEKETACDMAAFGFLFGDEGETGRMRMTDASHMLMVSKPAATQSVNRLVEQGFVERAYDPNDRRAVYIQPTDAGKRRFREEMERRMAFLDRAAARMGESRAQELAVLLNAFFEALVAETEETQC